MQQCNYYSNSLRQFITLSAIQVYTCTLDHAIIMYDINHIPADSSVDTYYSGIRSLLPVIKPINQQFVQQFTCRIHITHSVVGKLYIIHGIIIM